MNQATEFVPDGDLAKRWRLPQLITGRLSSGRTTSTCCGASLLMGSVLENGLIGLYCEECRENKGLLSKAEFRSRNWSFFKCPKCSGRLNPDIQGHNDFALLCNTCRIYLRLATLVPGAAYFSRRR